mmetsp:Transcript_88190/g.184269  ORF Transcript_88190/g.184269 Transcript_88190/m.184269 type:complete len:434 (+) Transcript_88190:139-1440(+)|eukprot:CAMPEP_0206487710 /NCGR_PEP_ID=MMETSP0324_2-20121206/41844_1 /ASSEMBLY_ACC=CAM_ASM_000836 /TAXON_ID=2866 /ORGANISM="Crypthecodinium cohnii, Strain Seligo" /LENGTH=433 /DNA_ID=CAMNT_0053966325 /DNA_START=65 /DNA_END=1366 /DNA_ORIENTATION=-
MSSGTGSGTEREVLVSLGELKFCAAHFVAFKGFREALHGHNYQVGLKAGGSLQADGYLTDFGVLKQAGKTACKALDQKTLVPIKSDVLRIERQNCGTGVLEIHCEEGDRLALPAKDCALVPVVHTTAEELSEHLWWDILTMRGLGDIFAQRGIEWFEVYVSERPGQGASFRAKVATAFAGSRPSRPSAALAPRPCLSAQEGFTLTCTDSPRIDLTPQLSSLPLAKHRAAGVMDLLKDLSREEIGEVAYKILLSSLGPEESGRPVLQRTPYRAAKAFREMTAGFSYEDPLTVVGNGIFDVPEAKDMVAVRDMTFNSMCEHHLLPFSGVAHVAYIPSGKVLGLSKFPRLLEVYARRLQLQERLSAQFADGIESLLAPKALAVALEATHGCMCHRGVGMAASTRTLVMRGPGKDEQTIKEQLTDGVSFLRSRSSRL